MNGGKKTGFQCVSDIHQTGNGKPSLNTAGPWDINAGTGCFEIANPIPECHANIDIDGQQEKLGGFSPATGIAPVIPRQFPSDCARAALPACFLLPVHDLLLSLIFPLLHSGRLIIGICYRYKDIVYLICILLIGRHFYHANGRV